MKKPSELLEESAAPFDLACIRVRNLEDATVKLMDGKDYHKLNEAEANMLGTMTSMGLLYVKDGFVRAVE